MGTKNIAMDGTWKTDGAGLRMFTLVGSSNLEWLTAAAGLSDAQINALPDLGEFNVQTPGGDLGRTPLTVWDAKEGANYWRAAEGVLVVTD